MGNQVKSREELLDYFRTEYIPSYIKNHRHYREDMLNSFSIISDKDRDRIRFQEIFSYMKDTGKYDKNLLKLEDKEV
jgi:hypothetical protein